MLKFQLIYGENGYKITKDLRKKRFLGNILTYTYYNLVKES